MNDNINSLTAEAVTPIEFAKKSETYLIPYYQRPYAWTTQEVFQLMSDLWTAYSGSKKSAEMKRNYYLGNIVLCRPSGDTQNDYHVIDGQQRLTTVFLIGCYFLEHGDNSWKDYLIVLAGTARRLRFLARDVDNTWLAFYSDSKRPFPRNESRNLGFETARRAIESFMAETPGAVDQLIDFSQYIYSRVSFAQVVLPTGLDYAQYFEVMNSRAMQLEKHEVLKARILSGMDKDDYPVYAAVWDACSQMDQYIDYGLSCDNKQQLFDFLEQRTTLAMDSVCRLFKNSGSQEKSESLNLSALVKATQKPGGDGKTVRSEPAEGRSASIVTFPVFLLLVFALVKSVDTETTTLDDANLLETVWGKNGEKWPTDLSKKKFVEEMLRFRILFDQYVIKGVREGDYVQRWLIRPLRSAEVSFTRADDEWVCVRMLQAMLHVSGVPKKEWMLPLLRDLSADCDPEVSFRKLADAERGIARRRIGNDPEALNRGVDTIHYAFHRLDFMLWQSSRRQLTERTQDKSHMPSSKAIVLDRTYDVLRDFVFRFRNSVEHVYPQTPKNGKDWKLSDLNSFGNLCLVSRSSNSSYSNQSPDDKRKDFSKRSEIESLKLLKIYKDCDNGSPWIWDAILSEEHRKDMIHILFEDLVSPPIELQVSCRASPA